MKKKLLGIFLAASLVVSGMQVPSIAHASEVHDHDEQVAVAAENVTCELVAEGSVQNPEFVVKRGNQTLVPDKAGALSYVLNNLTQEGDTIILSNATVELTADATVKAGVTLLLPYAAGKTEENPNKNDYATAINLYSTLVVKEDVRLQIQGKVIVAAETGVEQTGVNSDGSVKENNSIQNIITAGYSLIQTEARSIIDVANGGQLAVYGKVEGTGKLVAQDGAKVTDRYIILGYQGGGALIEELGFGEDADSYPYPFNQSGCAAIEISAKYYKGAAMYGATKIWVPSESQYFGEPFLLIGRAGDLTGLYVQGEADGAYVERNVTAAEKDKMLDTEIIRFVGGGMMTGSQLTIEVKKSFISLTVNVTTRSFVYPIGAHTSIEVQALNGADNKLVVDKAFKFLKGSKLTLGEGTSLTLSQKAVPGTFECSLRGAKGTDSSGYLVFYDGTQLVVNGKLHLEKEGTIGINPGSLVIGPNGSFTMACDHEDTTTLETREKSGNVTTSINWLEAGVKETHAETDWKKDENGHTGVCNIAGCGAQFESEEHTYIKTNEIAVDCVVDGQVFYQCDVCGYEKTEITAEAYGHKAAATWEIRQDEHVKLCVNPNCDEILEREAHDWNVRDYKEPTYTEEGYEDRDCKVCGESRKGSIPKLEDNTVPEVSFEFGATPIKVLNDILNLFNDDVTVRIQAVDNETGLATVEYYVSNVELSEREVSLLRDWTSYEKELKFTEDKDYFLYVKATDKSGNVAIHGYGGKDLALMFAIDRVAAEFSGLIVDGVNCGQTTVTVVDRYIDKVYVNDKEVTLSKDGSFILEPSLEPYTIRAVDHVGNESVLGDIMVNTGHDFTEWEILDGVHRRTCNTCGHKEESEHNYTKYEVVQEQSCDTDAISVRYCKECGVKDEQRKEAFGHRWMETERVDATARKDGYVKSVCFICRGENVEVIPALNGNGGSSSGNTSGNTSGNGGSNGSGSPTTNDSANIMMWASLGIAALVVAYTTRKKFG